MSENTSCWGPFAHAFDSKSFGISAMNKQMWDWNNALMRGALTAQLQATEAFSKALAGIEKNKFVDDMAKEMEKHHAGPVGEGLKIASFNLYQMGNLTNQSLKGYSGVLKSFIDTHYKNTEAAAECCTESSAEQPAAAAEPTENTTSKKAKA